MSKKQTLHVHAARRAASRFGINLTKEVENSIIRQIQSGAAKPIFKQSNRVTHFKVRVGGQEPIVLYDRNRHCLITFLMENKEIFYKELYG